MSPRFLLLNAHGPASVIITYITGSININVDRGLFNFIRSSNRTKFCHSAETKRFSCRIINYLNVRAREIKYFLCVIFNHNQNSVHSNICVSVKQLISHRISRVTAVIIDIEIIFVTSHLNALAKLFVVVRKIK